MLCHSMYMYTCCVRCVCGTCRAPCTCVCVCIGVWVYGCMHVCMYMPCVCHDCMWYNCKSSSRHANNKDKPSQTGEPACAGHPIIADRMPRTEGSSRLSGARSAFSPTSHGGPPLRARAPVRFAFLRENHPRKPRRTTIASLYTPALRRSLAPLANLATVRLPHRARPQALPRAYPAQYDRRDGVSSKRNLIHTAKCSVSSRAVRA